MDGIKSFFIIIMLPMVCLWAFYPLFFNRTEFISICNGYLENYKTTLSCKTDFGCTISNYSISNKLIKQYKFEAPHSIRFNSKAVPVLSFEGTPRVNAHLVKTMSTVFYFIEIDNYSFPVNESFQRELTKSVDTDFFHFEPEKLNQNLEISVSKSPAEISVNVAVMILYFFTVIMAFYCILAIVRVIMLEKDKTIIDKWINFYLPWAMGILGILLMMSLSMGLAFVKP